MVLSCMGCGGVESGIIGEGDGKKRRWGDEERKKSVGVTVVPHYSNLI